MRRRYVILTALSAACLGLSVCLLLIFVDTLAVPHMLASHLQPANCRIHAFACRPMQAGNSVNITLTPTQLQWLIFYLNSANTQAPTDEYSNINGDKRSTKNFDSDIVMCMLGNRKGCFNRFNSTVSKDTEQPPMGVVQCLKSLASSLGTNDFPTLSCNETGCKMESMCLTPLVAVTPLRQPPKSTIIRMLCQDATVYYRLLTSKAQCACPDCRVSMSNHGRYEENQSGEDAGHDVGYIGKRKDEHSTTSSLCIPSEINDCEVSSGDMSGVVMSSRSKPSGSNVSGNDVSGSDMSGSDVSGSELLGIDLSGSDLSGSDVSGSDVSGSDVSGSDVSGSDVTCSHLSNKALSGTGILWVGDTPLSLDSPLDTFPCQWAPDSPVALLHTVHTALVLAAMLATTLLFIAGFLGCFFSCLFLQYEDICTRRFY